MNVVKDTVGCKEAEGAPDLRHWEWLKTMIETLGDEGMSSEESDTDDFGRVIYRPKKLLWRRKMENELTLLDKEYLRVAKTKARSGPVPAQRRRAIGNAVSVREPAKGLPLCLYDEEWIIGKSDLYVEDVLQVAVDSTFKWRQIGSR